ncbi:MAG: MerR family transcriptional regulator [Pseudomonadota bacterium]
MRIAQAAEKSGLSVDTIRYYEKSGIVPGVARGADGKRHFSPENIDWLTLLYWLRQTGMPLKTMRDFAQLYRGGNSTVAARKTILLEHAALLQKRRSDLDRCAEQLQHKIQIYEELLK